MIEVKKEKLTRPERQKLSVVYDIHFYVLSRSALSMTLIPGIVLLVSQTLGRDTCYAGISSSPSQSMYHSRIIVLPQRTGRSLTPTIV
jgi:hypothetical protein